MTFALTAEFMARPGRREEVAALVRDFAVAVRSEPGNVRFDVHTLASAPHEFLIYETYTDRAAFDAHLANPAGVPFNHALSTLVVGGRSRLIFLDSEQTDSPVRGTA